MNAEEFIPGHRKEEESWALGRWSVAKVVGGFRAVHPDGRECDTRRTYEKAYFDAAHETVDDWIAGQAERLGKPYVLEPGARRLDGTPWIKRGWQQ